MVLVLLLLLQPLTGLGNFHESGTTNKLEMKGVPFLLFLLLVIISTIDAQKNSRKIIAKVRVKGKLWKVRNTPATCCKKRGRGYWIKTPQSLSKSVSECQILCPLFKALKGCDFMCHWYLCNRDTNGDYGQCKTKCESEQSTIDTTGDGDVIDLDMLG